MLKKKVSLLKRWFSSTDSQLLRMTKLLQSTVSKKVSIISKVNQKSFNSILESTLNMVIRLCGGKKKRKKKVYTKPKKIKHKHRKRTKALLEYFNFDNTGKISKLKIECEKCPAGKLLKDKTTINLLLYNHFVRLNIYR